MRNGVQTSIFLETLEVTAPVGIHPTERAGAQKLLIDMVLEVDPPAQDAIEAAVDYETLASKIRTLAAQRHRDLLETLAVEMVNLVREDRRVKSGYIKIYKPSLLGAAKVGVAVAF